MKIQDIDTSALRVHIYETFLFYSNAVEDANQLRQSIMETRLHTILGVLGVICVDEEEYLACSEYMLSCAVGIKHLPHEWGHTKYILDKRRNT